MASKGLYAVTNLFAKYRNGTNCLQAIHCALLCPIIREFLIHKVLIPFAILNFVFLVVPRVLRDPKLP